MWVALDGNDPESVAVEHVLARLEAVVRFANDLVRCFGDAGLGTSLGEVLGVHRHLKAVIDDVPAADLARAIDDTRRLLDRFTAIAQRLDELTRLQRLLGAPPSVASGARSNGH